MACPLVVDIVGIVDDVVGMIVMVLLVGDLVVIIVLCVIVVLGVVALLRVQVLVLLKRLWVVVVLLHNPRTCLGIRSLRVLFVLCSFWWCVCVGLVLLGWVPS